MRRDQGPAKQDMRRREHNPLAGTGYPAQPKATNPPPYKHLKKVAEHQQQKGGTTNGRSS